MKCWTLGGERERVRVYIRIRIIIHVHTPVVYVVPVSSDGPFLAVFAIPSFKTSQVSTRIYHVNIAHAQSARLTRTDGRTEGRTEGRESRCRGGDTRGAGGALAPPLFEEGGAEPPHFSCCLPLALHSSRSDATQPATPIRSGLNCSEPRTFLMFF